MSEKEAALEAKVNSLTKTVEKLVELVGTRIVPQNGEQMESSQSSISKKELEEMLKDRPLGELVIFALKHNLIKRRSFDTQGKDIEE